MNKIKKIKKNKKENKFKIFTFIINLKFKVIVS